MKQRHVLPVTLTIIAVLFIAVMAWSLKAFGRYQPYSGFMSDGMTKPRAYTIVLNLIDVRCRHMGSLAWTVRTDKMTLSADRSNLLAEGIRNGVIFQNAKPAIDFHADRAVYTSGSFAPQLAGLEVDGGISIATAPGASEYGARFKIAATKAVWTGYLATLSCPAPVTAVVYAKNQALPTNITAQSLVWNDRAKVLTCPDNVNATVPLAEPGKMMTVTAQNVSWSKQMSLLSCNGQSHIACPFPGTDTPAVFDTKQATWSQQGEQLTCTAPVNASFILPETGTHVDVTAPTATWTPQTGSLKVPTEATATIASLGVLNAQPVEIDTQTHATTFGNLRLVADSTVPMLPSDSGTLPPMPTSGPDATSVKPLSIGSAIDTTKPPENDASVATPVDESKVYVDAPQGGHWDEQNRVLEIRGPVTFTQGDATLSTIGAIYDRKTEIAHALSPVTITDPENVLTADHGDVNFRKKVATLTSNVHLIDKPKPDAPAPPATPADAGAKAGTAPSDTANSNDDPDEAAEKKQPTELKCDTMSYDYHNKMGDASGHLIVTQKTRTITALTGHYDATTKIVEMVGNVVGTSTDGKVLHAPKATASTKKGDEWVDFPSAVKFVFTVDPDDDGSGSESKGKNKESSPKATDTTTAPTSPTASSGSTPDTNATIATPPAASSSSTKAQ